MKISDQNSNFFLGNTPFGKQEMNVSDRIAMKKQLYQKQAMHVVTSTNKSEKKIDKSITDREERIRKLHDENEEYNRFYTDYKQQMEQAKKDYGIEDDSQEQKDLELLQKEYDISNHHGLGEFFTEEELERLSNMGEMTEYQKYAMDLYAQADYWKTKMSDNQKEMKGENAIIRSIKLERLKHHAMVDAEKSKEEILAAASKEAVGMLIDDAKSQIDNKTEEVKEEAAEKKEKEQEEEKRLEAAKENRTESEAAVERNRENIQNMTQQMLESDDITRDINDEVKKIMEEEKLLEEDLKGLTLDKGV